MATGMPSRFAGPWAALSAAAVAWVVVAQDASPAEDSNSRAFTPPSAENIQLEFRDAAHGIGDLRVFVYQRGPFRNEPAAESNQLYRCLLDFHNYPSNSVPFLWQPGIGRLDIDANRNGDLSDDPGATYRARPARAGEWQTFTDVHLSFDTPRGRWPMSVDLSLARRGARPMASAELRSYWEAKVAIETNLWQLGLIQLDPARLDWLSGGQILLRPWEEREQGFSLSSRMLDTFPMTRKVFAGGHAYRLDWSGEETNGQAQPVLRLTEESVPLGELRITGKYIRRLVLPGDSYLVVLDSPGDTVRIPTGRYQQPAVRLSRNGTEAVSLPGSAPGKGVGVAGEGAITTLNVGGPLTNLVVASRSGPDLRLDYVLVGTGGEHYQLSGSDRSNPPRFSIYRGASQVAAGAFEFG